MPEHFQGLLEPAKLCTSHGTRAARKLAVMQRRGKRRQVRVARAGLFAGLFDGTSGLLWPGVSIVRCPRCRRTVGTVTAASWRYASRDICGACLAPGWLDRDGAHLPHVRLLNPDYTDDNATGRRFSLLEIE
jgi:hypothetical protein